MATWHRGADAALETDIESLARCVSAHVCTSLLPGALRADGVEALRATRRDARNAPGAKGRVSTLIVPHDRSWEPFECPEGPEGDTGGTGGATTFFDGAYEDDEDDVGTRNAVLRNKKQETAAFLDLCADALVTAPRGKVALYCGGDALLAADGAIQAAGAVAALLGGELLCENNFARVDRGFDLPSPRRLPYFPKDAARELARFHTVVCVDAKRPVAMFGYADAGPSHLLRLEEDRVWDLDVGGDSARTVADVVVGLRDAVAKRLGRHVPTSAKHNDDAYWTVPPRPRPKLPFGVDLSIDADADGSAHGSDASPKTTTRKKLTPDAMCAIVAALQPEDCVVVDESLTSGTSYWDKSAGCSRFQHLTLTGGAIGLGPCASVGAAVAAGASRRVVNLQADGCAAYAPQALWTQARERLNVVTVVCANARYAILELEQMMQRTNSNNDVSREPRASKRLTTLADPKIDWTRVAEGFGVPAARAECPEGFARAFKRALERNGPSLIEAVLA